MWRTSDQEPQMDPGLMRGGSITPGNGRPASWNLVTRLIWRHLLLFGVAVAISFALIRFETTTRLFFRINPPLQVGDPCLTLIRPTKGPNAGVLWSNFGPCPDAPRDPDREMIMVDLRHGLLLHYKTEPVLVRSLPLPFTRVLRNRDHFSRAFGKGGTHSYDMALVGDLSRLSWVDLVLAGGGRVHYLPGSRPGWFDSDVGGYFADTRLRWTGRDWWIVRDDGVGLQFPESEHSTRLEQAALVAIGTSTGETKVMVRRDQAGNILSLDAGRSGPADFRHDALNRVTAISIPSTNQIIRFEYDSVGCLVRRTSSDGDFQYDYDLGDNACRLSRIANDGVTYFKAEYSPDDRLVRLTNAAGGVYSLSYQVDRDDNVLRTDVIDPDGLLRRVTLDNSGYWISRWGSYRR